MAGVYHQRHPERTLFYRVLFHYFEKFLSEYESRFEKEYGYLRPVIQEGTAGHHEARRAVVISWVYSMEQNEIATLRSQQASTVAIRSVGLRGFAVLSMERKDC